MKATITWAALILAAALPASAAGAPAGPPPAETVPATFPDVHALSPLDGALFLSHCAVQYTQCWDNNPISCTGHTSCTSGTTSQGQGWVDCDGVRTYCGGCKAKCRNSPDTCFGSSSCFQGYDFGWYIECDGIRIQCPACPPPQIVC